MIIKTVDLDSFSSTPAEDETTYAREKFGNQRAISSDMYFERNAYDSNAQAEARDRLQQFQGATAISSNAYFGRSEEENDTESSMVDGSLLGDGSLAGLEYAAKDMIQRVMASPDVQNLGETIRSGALKVSFGYALYLYRLTHPLSYPITYSKWLSNDEMLK